MSIRDEKMCNKIAAGSERSKVHICLCHFMNSKIIAENYGLMSFDVDLEGNAVVERSNVSHTDLG